MTDGCHRSQMGAWQSLLAKYDTDGAGSISRAEFGVLVGHLLWHSARVDDPVQAVSIADQILESIGFASQHVRVTPETLRRGLEDGAFQNLSGALQAALTPSTRSQLMAELVVNQTRAQRSGGGSKHPSHLPSCKITVRPRKMIQWPTRVARRGMRVPNASGAPPAPRGSASAAARPRRAAFCAPST
jgi:hypothetical protein